MGLEPREAAPPVVRRTLRAAVARLDVAGVSSPTLTARLLLEMATGRPREWLLAHDETVLDPAACEAFDELLRRVSAHEPLAYVLGHREFYGLDLIVDPRALIPRPETELLVESALACVAEGGFACDVGTGSGAVALAIAAHAPRARVIASDISADALAVARLNAQRLAVTNVAFVQADLLCGIDAAACDVVVANLPYVTREEIDALPPEIRAHEPRVALDGGDDGLALVRRLLRQLSAHVRRPHRIRGAFLEIGASQGPAALSAARAILPDARAAIKQDLARLDRVIALHFGA